VAVGARPHAAGLQHELRVGEGASPEEAAERGGAAGGGAKEHHPRRADIEASTGPHGGEPPPPRPRPRRGNGHRRRRRPVGIPVRVSDRVGAGVDRRGTAGAWIRSPAPPTATTAAPRTRDEDERSLVIQSTPRFN